MKSSFPEIVKDYVVAVPHLVHCPGRSLRFLDECLVGEDIKVYSMTISLTTSLFDKAMMNVAQVQQDL